MSVPWLLAVSFVLFLVLNVPIGAAIGLSSLLAVWLGNVVPLSTLTQSLIVSVDSFPILAVPLFILAGDLMGSGGISRRLLDTANVFFGRYTGGLSIVAVVTCMFFAAISGSGPATVAAIGGIMIPSMLESRYGASFSCAMLASAGSIGVIIPPSIPMVLYCLATNVSVTDLFVAGFIPGILVGLSLCLYGWLKSRKEGYAGSPRRYTAGEKLKTVWEAKWSLAIPFIILGGIYGGVFTPTEAAGVAVGYGFVIGKFIYRTLPWRELYSVLSRSALTTGTVFIIIGSAAALGRILTIEEIPTRLASAMIAFTDNRVLILLIINALLLFVGCIMEISSAVLILAPILLPVATAVGVDPVHFGIIMIVNLAIGFITPPLGVNLFVACRIGGVTLEEIVKAVIGPLVFMLAVLALITYVPSLSTFLPSLLR